MYSICREFESNGLSRYGCELEDDADDVLVLQSMLTTPSTSEGHIHTTLTSDKPSLCTVAYDSELDKTSDDSD